MSMLLNWEKLSREYRDATAKFSFGESIACDSAKQKIFLSHRFLDKEKVLAVKYKLESYGYYVFVDWEQKELQNRAKVDKKVATTILDEMSKCDVLIFVITENFIDSSWMAWELGLFHGSKGANRVALMPVEDKTNGTYIKTEFLQLYPYIDEVVVKKTGKMNLWINDPEFYPQNYKKYVSFDDWISSDKQPFER